MEHKYILGSKMLQMANPRDVDEVTFVDKKSWEVRESNKRSISFTKKIIDSFINGNNTTKDPFKSLYLYQQSVGFFTDEAYPFKDFNILDHKQVWGTQLKRYMNHDTTEARALKNELLDKTFYHILYQYYMIKENVHWISDEAKAQVQKIHDLEMPSSYFYELRDLINSL